MHMLPTNQNLEPEVSHLVERYYKGKVRDVYFLKNGKLLMHASDRISAFDVILPKPIPGKGALLNSLAAFFLNEASSICPVWLENLPAPQVSVGKACKPIPIEMVVRGYLVGHALRTYQSGHRTLCGVQLPEGMLPYQAFSRPIVTPATKAEQGHDEDISAAEIMQRGILSEAQWNEISSMALRLFEQGQAMAAERGLILMDTKYEFGWYQNQLMLMDEIHTPDSSRYAYADDLKPGISPKQLSKEFVREWLMDQGFQGKEGQTMPIMNDEVVERIYDRYAELYRALTGQEPPCRDAFNSQQILVLLKEVSEA